MGAFGTHALRDRVSERAFAAWQTGAQYHLAHALVVLAVAVAAAGGVLMDLPARRTLRLFQAGIVIFCGSLYAYGATGLTVFGIVAPLGGLLLMTGWLFLAWSAYQKPHVTA